MPTAKPTYSEILQDSQQFIQTRTGLSNWAEGSIIGSIVTLHAQKQSEIYDLITQSETARDLELASGQDLDNLARSLGGIIRNPATTAGANSSTAQLLVTNTSATATLSFPAGTAVWSSIDPITRLYTTTSVTVSPQNSTAVFVQASQPGVSYNIASGQINSHNSNPSFIVTNFLPIVGGSGMEADDAFRYRISQILQAAILGGQSSAQGMILALIALSGVADVILMPESRGPGTVDALIVTEAGYLPDDDFLTSCTEEMARVAAAGISVKAIAPTTIPVISVININATGQNASLSPQGPLRSMIQSVVENYINTRTVQSDPIAGVVNPYNIGTSTNDSYISYSSLLTNISNAAISLLGNSIQNVMLSFMVGSATDQAFQTDLYARNGEVFRSLNVQVNINYS